MGDLFTRAPAGMKNDQEEEEAFSGRRADLKKKRISLLMDGTKSYFTSVPLDVSQSPTMVFMSGRFTVTMHH